MIDLSGMTYLELFRLNRLIEREMSFRSEPWIIIGAIGIFIGIAIYSYNRSQQ